MSQCCKSISSPFLFLKPQVQFKYATTSKSLSKFMSLEQNGLQVTLLDQEGPVQVS